MNDRELPAAGSARENAGMPLEEALLSVIAAEGPDYPERYPWETYRKLTALNVPALQSRLMLISLAAGAAGLEKSLAETCGMRADLARGIADVLIRVFSPENLRMWTQKKEAGFRTFLKNTWEYRWNGAAAWHEHLLGRAGMQASLQVASPEKARSVVAPLLCEHPYAAAEDIFRIFTEKLDLQMEQLMDEYIAADDYYDPYMEEFVSGFAAEPFAEFCNELGLTVRSADGDGSSEWWF